MKKQLFAFVLTAALTSNVLAAPQPPPQSRGPAPQGPSVSRPAHPQPQRQQPSRPHVQRPMPQPARVSYRPTPMPPKVVYRPAPTHVVYHQPAPVVQHVDYCSHNVPYSSCHHSHGSDNVAAATFLGLLGGAVIFAALSY